MDTEKFRRLYTYAFKYCLESDRQKAIDVETAAHMLQLVLRDRPHVRNFVKFLKARAGMFCCFVCFMTSLEGQSEGCQPRPLDVLP